MKSGDLVMLKKVPTSQDFEHFKILLGPGDVGQVFKVETVFRTPDFLLSENGFTDWIYDISVWHEDLEIIYTI